jgi:hypothetical protein
LFEPVTFAFTPSGFSSTPAPANQSILSFHYYCWGSNGLLQIK